jgi:hypothetical protein
VAAAAVANARCHLEAWRVGCAVDAHGSAVRCRRHLMIPGCPLPLPLPPPPQQQQQHVAPGYVHDAWTRGTLYVAAAPCDARARTHAGAAPDDARE